jgi:hypothetical protein
MKSVRRIIGWRRFGVFGLGQAEYPENKHHTPSAEEVILTLPDIKKTGQYVIHGHDDGECCKDPLKPRRYFYVGVFLSFWVP